jgi:hypothetical protein
LHQFTPPQRTSPFLAEVSVRVALVWIWSERRTPNSAVMATITTPPDI